MSTSDLTPTAMFETLTGFDEIAIRKAFGANVTDFASKGAQRNPMMFARALIFTDRRRHGDRDTEAYQASMSLTMADVNGYFAEDPADDPADDQGEDGDDLDDLDDQGDDWGKAPSA